MLHLTWKNLDGDKTFVIEGNPYMEGIPQVGRHVDKLIRYLNWMYFDGLVELNGYEFKWDLNSDESGILTVTCNGETLPPIVWEAVMCWERTDEIKASISGVSA